MQATTSCDPEWPTLKWPIVKKETIFNTVPYEHVAPGTMTMVLVLTCQ